MKNVSRNGKMRGIFLVSLFTICTVAVIWRRFGASNTSNPEQQSVRDSLYQQKRVLQYNTKVYSQAVRLAEDGDVIFKLDTANTPTNGDTTISYNQSGIISRQQDTVFVYYTTTNSSGFLKVIRCEPLWNFSHPANSTKLALYRILADSGSRKKLMLIVREQYQKKELPDSVWQLAADEKVQGNTFVAFNIERALDGNIIFNRSTKNGRSFFIPEDIIGNSSMKAIKQWAY